MKPAPAAACSTHHPAPNLSACAQWRHRHPRRDHQLTTPNPGVNTGAFVVDGEVEADTKYKKAIVRMKDTTVIQRKQGEEIFPASVVDLEIGKRVEIKFTGVVAELNPTQAAAGEITILE